MAKRIIHQLIDDLDGSDADETVRFSVEGVDYEMDLSKRNVGKFNTTLQPWVEVATKVGRTSRAAPYRRAVSDGRTPATAADRDRNREIRDWLVATGFAINDRGRIRQHLVELWENRARLDQDALREALAEFGTPEAQAAAVAAPVKAMKPAAVPVQKAAPATEATNGKTQAALVAASRPAAKKTAPARKVAAAAK